MSTVVDPTFIDELKGFGAFDVNACFNCGNCTAVCPLSIGNDSFPRKMIRNAQIGDKDRLIAGKEIWLCYYCGECSDTCPRQAEPGEFMASVRRYAIASADPTGISRLLYTSKLFTVIFLTALSILFALILISGKGPMKKDPPAFFKYGRIEGFLSFDIIHDMGLAVIGLAVLAAVGGAVRMALRLARAAPRTQAKEIAGEKQRGFLTRFIPSVKNVLAELAAQKRYRDCAEESNVPWYRSHWFIHWSIMWGFIGLGVATGIDYLWMIIGDKMPGQPDPLWYPGRLVGTLTGILFMYGTSMALIFRFTKPDKYSSHSLLSDWLFLWLLFLTGLTGFLLEIAVYLPTGTLWGYLIFLVHVVLGMEIVVLLPFTKFAHFVYRPLALFIHEMTRSDRI